MWLCTLYYTVVSVIALLTALYYRQHAPAHVKLAVETHGAVVAAAVRFFVIQAVASWQHKQLNTVLVASTH
jgi:hypothetical protein